MCLKALAGQADAWFYKLDRWHALHGLRVQEIDERHFTPPREAATPGGHPAAPVVRFELPCYPEIGSLYAEANVEDWGGLAANFTPCSHARRVEAILYCVQVRLIKIVSCFQKGLEDVCTY